MTRINEDHSKRCAELGWRRGCAPDCKAPHNPCEINSFPENRYQDKSRTLSERDNSPFAAQNPTNENPGALAGATGADFEDWFSWFDHNVKRGHDARKLIAAVLDCEPADRLLFIELIAEVLGAGSPIPPFGSVMAEANLWAREASRAELKAYCAASYMHLPPADRQKFRSFADERATA